MTARSRTRLILSLALVAAPLFASGQADYFHTGAGARYLRRADADIVATPLRGGITVLTGSGGNITVLSSPDGKFLGDAGIGKSRDKLQAALGKLGPAPVKYVVDTHWHWEP